MDILTNFQLTIFSPSTIFFIAFYYKSIPGFLFKLLQSSRRRKSEVALDFYVWLLCVAAALIKVANNPLKQPEFLFASTHLFEKLERNQKFTKPEVFIFGNGVANVFRVQSIFGLSLLHMRYDDFNYATKRAGNARKNFSCDQNQFMKLHLTRNTGAAMNQKRRTTTIKPLSAKNSFQLENLIVVHVQNWSDKDTRHFLSCKVSSKNSFRSRKTSHAPKYYT